MGCWPLALYEGELSPSWGLGLLVQVALAWAAPGQGPSSGASPSERVIEDEEDGDDSDDDEEDCGDGRVGCMGYVLLALAESAAVQVLVVVVHVSAMSR